MKVVNESNCSALVVWNENCAWLVMKYADLSWRRLSKSNMIRLSAHKYAGTRKYGESQYYLYNQVTVMSDMDFTRLSLFIY
jgi:hypothetical protein